MSDIWWHQNKSDFIRKRSEQRSLSKMYDKLIKKKGGITIRLPKGANEDSVRFLGRSLRRDLQKAHKIGREYREAFRETELYKEGSKIKDTKKGRAMLNKVDAMRHSMWSKEVAKDVGPWVSAIAGYGQEFTNIWKSKEEGRNSLGEILMDLHNNSEGRRAAREGRPINPDNLVLDPDDAWEEF